MQRSTKNGTLGSYGYQKEQIFFGKGAGTRQPAVGRIIFEGSIDSFSGREALLAVCSKLAAEELERDERIVGVVRIDDGECPTAEPPCPSITLASLPRECNGRIALLDPAEGRLFVCPDISTVNEYTPRLASAGKRKSVSHFTLPNGRALRLVERVQNAAEARERMGASLLLPNARPLPEEELFETYRDVLEGDIGNCHRVMLSADNDLEVSLRALMRAAVWGECEAVLCGVHSKKELEGALRALHRCFCELEADGREFNGYIPRGLCIDTPYMLSIAETLCGADLFLYDTDRLLYLLCGRRENIPKEVREHLLERICSLSREKRGVRHMASIGRSFAERELCVRLCEAGISELAADKDVIELISTYFSPL